MRRLVLAVTVLSLLATSAAAVDFLPGDKLLLTVRVAAPVTLDFDGVSGMEVGFKVKRIDGSDATVRLDLVSPTSVRHVLGTADVKGKLKTGLTLDEAGTWRLEVHSADGSYGNVKMKTKAEVTTKFSAKLDVPAGGAVTFPFTAVVNAVVSIKLSGKEGPVVDDLRDPDGGSVALIVTKTSKKKYEAGVTAAPASGAYALDVATTTGAARVKTKVKAKWLEGGTTLDQRVTPDAQGLLGRYQGGFLTLSGAADAEFGIMTGGLSFDGLGSFTHTMARHTVVEDAAAPTGYRLDTEIPGAAVPGLYAVNGTSATLDFDPGSVSGETADLNVLMDGRLLLPSPEAGEGVGTGFLGRIADAVKKSDLKGDYLYVFVEQGIRGTPPDAEIAVDVEAGLLRLGDGGSVLGGGMKMLLVLDRDDPAGYRTESSEMVLALGSYSVGDDGEVTFEIARTLFGATTTHVLTALSDGSMLYAGGLSGGDGISAKFMMRQGSDVTTADVSGDYLHAGNRMSSVAGVQTVTTRTGTLAFDGAGGFSGMEEVTDTITTDDNPPVVVEHGQVAQSGTYSVGTLSLTPPSFPLTLTFSGESAVQGIIGPDASYMLAFSMDGGLGFDMFVKK
jgi:hypothetical protein